MQASQIDCSMILSDEQIYELRRRLKINYIPNWKSLPGLSDQEKALKSILSDIFLRKRNETVLLLGPGGCGKHLLIDFCMNELYTENKDSNPNVFSSGEYIRINLDGDYIDSDDDAFRIIARQLTSPVMRHKRLKNAQYKNMEFLELVLQEAQICNVPLLFVLDHFSAFCHQNKQTLLYTLLDLCSNNNVQMGVIGIDRDCTITERLEKRIQSRFSQRQIVVNYPSSSDVAQFVASTLFLPGHQRDTLKWNSAVKGLVLNKEFNQLVEEQSVVFPLSFHILFDKLLYFLMFANLPSRLRDFNITFWKKCFMNVTQQNTTMKNHALHYLGVNDLALLIAAKHFVQRKIANFCFLDLLDSYNKWASSSTNFQLVRMSETLGWQSFQILIQFGLVKYVSGTSLVAGGSRNENSKKGTVNTVLRSGNEKNAPVILLIQPEEIDRIIKEEKLKCPTVLENWALKWSE